MCEIIYILRLLRDIKVSFTFKIEPDFCFQFHKSCRAGQYEYSDYKLSSIPMNCWCDTAT
jgi:hypothetical protein